MFCSQCRQARQRVLAGKGLLWGKRSLRDLEPQSELKGEPISDTTLHDVLVRLSPEGLRKLIASQVKQAIKSKELRPAGIAVPSDSS